MDEVLRHLRAITGGRRRVSGGGELVAHRILRNRGIEDLGEQLDRARRCGLVESYGRGSRRHHALTKEALEPRGS